MKISMETCSEMASIDKFFQPSSSPALWPPYRCTTRWPFLAPKISACCCSLERPRPVQKKVLPTHRLYPQPLDGNRRRLIAQHKRMIFAIAEHEFSEAALVSASDRRGLHFDRPLAPGAFENRINFERFLAPIAHLLPHIPCMSETRILNPRAKSRRLSLCRELPSDQSRPGTRYSASRAWVERHGGARVSESIS